MQSLLQLIVGGRGVCAGSLVDQKEVIQRTISPIDPEGMRLWKAERNGGDCAARELEMAWPDKQFPWGAR